MKRATFRAQITLIAAEKLVFLDECGFSLNLHQLYGWAPTNQRCVEAVPFNKGVNHSILGAYSLPSPSNPTGLWAIWQKIGAWTGLLFESFVEEELLPHLPEGSVLVLDNARIHHNPSLQAKVEAAGCSLLFLPPYSPDFNPIELVWSWLKNAVRLLGPRTDSQRYSYIEQVQKLLPPAAAPKWFKYSGILEFCNRKCYKMNEKVRCQIFFFYHSIHSVVPRKWWNHRHRFSMNIQRFPNLSFWLHGGDKGAIPADFNRFQIQNASGAPLPVIYVDDML